MFRRLFALIIIMLLTSPPIMRAQQDEPITLHILSASPISTLDPQRASDMASFNGIEQLFLGLMDYDPELHEPVPELAIDWTVSADGLVWTFTIRDDVPWVRWNPDTNSGEVVRMVNAYDFEYGIKRGCDPRLGAYTWNIEDIISGCADLVNKDAEEVTDADYDLVQVRALDNTTLEIHLIAPAGYFLNIATLPHLRPVPPELIAEQGDDWTAPGMIWTNGPFMLDDWFPTVRSMYLHNPYLPDDLRGTGNVEQVVVTVIDGENALSLYPYADIVTRLRPTDLTIARTDYADQLRIVSGDAVWYFAFDQLQAPFDNVHARRAFSAMLNRERFIEEIRRGYGLPMIHAVPPGTFGALPTDQVGSGYDPDYARAEMELAGYPNCDNFPPIDILFYYGSGAWAEFLVASTEEVLGCDPTLFTLENIEFIPYPEVPTLDYEAPRYNLWLMGWGEDYPDAYDWLYNLFSCEIVPDNPSMMAYDMYLKRPCSAADVLLTQATLETDFETRAALYAQIETLLFGPEGEQPVLPLFFRVAYGLYQPWIDGPANTDAWGMHYDWYTIEEH